MKLYLYLFEATHCIFLDITPTYSVFLSYTVNKWFLHVPNLEVDYCCGFLRFPQNKLYSTEAPWYSDFGFLSDQNYSLNKQFKSFNVQSWNVSKYSI